MGLLPLHLHQELGHYLHTFHPLKTDTFSLHEKMKMKNLCWTPLLWHFQRNQHTHEGMVEVGKLITDFHMDLVIKPVAFSALTPLEYMNEPHLKH